MTMLNRTGDQRVVSLAPYTHPESLNRPSVITMSRVHEFCALGPALGVVSGDKFGFGSTTAKCCCDGCCCCDCCCNCKRLERLVSVLEYLLGVQHVHNHCFCVVELVSHFLHRFLLLLGGLVPLVGSVVRSVASPPTSQLAGGVVHSHTVVVCGALTISNKVGAWLGTLTTDGMITMVTKTSKGSTPRNGIPQTVSLLITCFTVDTSNMYFDLF